MKNIKRKFTYGTKTIDLLFPEEFLAGEHIEPKENPDAVRQNKMADKIDETLANPVSSPVLKDMVNGKKVGLVISDEFRFGLQELIAQRVMNEIFKGNPESLDIFIATGSHDTEIYSKNIVATVNKIADVLDKKVRILPHNCDSDDHICIGRTSLGTSAFVWKEWLKTEVRVYGHESKHHYMNGYSVIDKQLCPGLSSRSTIESTHKNALQEKYSATGRTPYHKDETRRKNPFAQDNREVRLLADSHIIIDEKLINSGPLPSFLLDMISTKDSINWIMAGNPDIVAGHMTEAADNLSAFELSSSQYVVLSPGGPPACNALYGVQNSFDTVLKYAIHNGGEALILAPCLGRPDLPDDVRGLAPDKKSKILFWDNLVKLLPKPLAESTKWIEDNFELYLWKTDRILKLQLKQKIKLYLYSELAPEIIMPGGFIPVKDPNEWIAERAERNDGKVRTIDQGNKLLVIPEE